MIVRTPRPSSPSRRARVPSSSISAEALERLPSLSLSRTTSSRLREPSGSARGTTKHDNPSGAWARTRKTSFIGAEVNHLCPCSVYSPVDAGRPRLGDVGPDVGAALLLRHPHAGQRAGLLGDRPDARVVRRRGERRRPLLGQGVVDAEGRHRRVRHRDRAAVPRLGLRPGQEPGRAAYVGVLRAGVALLPRRRLQPVPDRPRHQPVPRRVEGDLVDAVAEAVVRRQLGLVACWRACRARGPPRTRPRDRARPGRRRPRRRRGG